MKRDGDVILGALSTELLFNSTSIARENTVLTQVDFIPKLSKQLQETSDEVIKDLREVRKCSGFHILIKHNDSC
jgi:Zn-dependent M16 (insulinase) family peptidase